MLSSIALLQSDTFFARRVAACAAEQKTQAGAYLNPPDPWDWAIARSWDMAAQPGFGDAYQYAIDTGVPNPGNDQSVITDGQILASVQTMVSQTLAVPTAQSTKMYMLQWLSQHGVTIDSAILTLSQTEVWNIVKDLLDTP